MAGKPRRIALKPDIQVSRIPEQSLASPVNMFAEVQSGKGAFPLHSHPGMTLLTTLAGVVRGQACIDGVHYVVAGVTFYRLSGAVATEIGTVMGSGPVQIAYNRFQVGVVTDPRLYVYDRETLTFDEVIATEDNGFAGASALCVVNGTGVFIEPGGDRFNVTGLNDFSSINPTEVSTAESRSDPLVNCVTLGSSLYLLGADTIEVWDNTGDGDFPFNRTLVIDLGLVSRETSVVIGPALYFVGRERESGCIGVYVLSGGRPQKISTPPVDRLLERAGFIDQATALTWSIDGHVFYRLNTTAGSVEFDLSTTLWTRVGSGVWGMATEPGPSLLTTCCAVDGAAIFGDGGGRLLRATFDANDIGGDVFVREFTTPVTGDLGAQTIVDELELECETGVGTISLDPVVYLTVSKDGGHRWSVPREGRVGKVGRYGRRVYWDRLGMAGDWVFRFRMTDAVPLKVTGVWALVEQTRRP